jgi:hypothetical protein
MTLLLVVHGRGGAGRHDARRFVGMPHAMRLGGLRGLSGRRRSAVLVCHAMGPHVSPAPLLKRNLEVFLTQQRGRARYASPCGTCRNLFASCGRRSASRSDHLAEGNCVEAKTDVRKISRDRPPGTRCRAERSVPGLAAHCLSCKRQVAALALAMVWCGDSRKPRVCPIRSCRLVNRFSAQVIAPRRFP